MQHTHAHLRHMAPFERYLYLKDKANQSNTHTCCIYKDSSLSAGKMSSEMTLTASCFITFLQAVNNYTTSFNFC